MTPAQTLWAALVKRCAANTDITKARAYPFNIEGE